MEQKVENHLAMPAWKRLEIDPAASKRLQDKFDDKRLVFGRMPHCPTCSVWYFPDNSAPYCVCQAVNVCQAEKILAERRQLDKRRAIEMLAQIDEHNAKVIDQHRLDAILELKSNLRQIAAGKKWFT